MSGVSGVGGQRIIAPQVGSTGLELQDTPTPVWVARVKASRPDGTQAEGRLMQGQIAGKTAFFLEDTQAPNKYLLLYPQTGRSKGGTEDVLKRIIPNQQEAVRRAEQLIRNGAALSSPKAPSDEAAPVLGFTLPPNSWHTHEESTPAPVSAPKPVTPPAVGSMRIRPGVGFEPVVTTGAPGSIAPAFTNTGAQATVTNIIGSEPPVPPQSHLPVTLKEPGQFWSRTTLGAGVRTFDFKGPNFLPNQSWALTNVTAWKTQEGNNWTLRGVFQNQDTTGTSGSFTYRKDGKDGQRTRGQFAFNDDFRAFTVSQEYFNPNWYGLDLRGRYTTDGGLTPNDYLLYAGVGQQMPDGGGFPSINAKIPTPWHASLQGGRTDNVPQWQARVGLFGKRSYGLVTYADQGKGKETITAEAGYRTTDTFHPPRSTLGPDTNALFVTGEGSSVQLRGTYNLDTSALNTQFTATHGGPWGHVMATGGYNTIGQVFSYGLNGAYRLWDNTANGHQFDVYLQGGVNGSISPTAQMNAARIGLGIPLTPDGKLVLNGGYEIPFDAGQTGRKPQGFLRFTYGFN